MRLKIWEKWKRIILLGTFFVLAIGIPWEIRAENATVTFGSNYYTATDNETFPIGVYLNGDSRIGTYEVKISYDNRRLEYTGGGDSEENGVITLSGTGVNAQVKYMLKFQTRSGGTADIKIESAVIHTAGENAEEFDVTTLASTYVTISGEDTVGDTPPEESQETETGEENPVSDIPTVMEVPVEEQTYYLVDLSRYTPENIDFQYDTGTITYQGTEVAAYLSANGDISFVYLADSQKNLYLYAYSSEKDKLYPCNSITVNGEKYYFMSPYVCSEWPQELTLDIIQSESIVYAMDLEGQTGFYKITTGNKLETWNPNEGQENFYNQMMKLVIILAVTLVIMILAIVLVVRMDKNRKERSHPFGLGKEKVSTETFQQSDTKKSKDHNWKNKFGNETSNQDGFEIEDLSLDISEDEIRAWKAEIEQSAGDSSAANNQKTSAHEINFAGQKVTTDQTETVPEERAGEEPVIAVRDVTMQFRIAMNNVSGIKEYVIQLLKKQISYRELLALDHVSFNVYKGEVVGIIGTNGSGKSTLLKIVSGALKPSSGEVQCDRRKVQLLTLGTGFDVELTAKENVYLNGAIIGYSKEFIDSKYDEIVRFAELEGFMEEKVKNFSSGMVSRLGFAIATIGETAEILILDEVLSVGDEFFRKKSLKRVQEMIHGGSTVLLVSHSMGTILENCDRVVWIEKGKMKMCGEPKVVCEAYRKMNLNE